MESRESLRFMVKFGLEPVFLASPLKISVVSLENFDITAAIIKGVRVVENNEGADILFWAKVNDPQFPGMYSWISSSRLLGSIEVDLILEGILGGTIDYLCTAETC